MLLQTNERIEKWDKQMKILICLGEGIVKFFPLQFNFYIEFMLM